MRGIEVVERSMERAHMYMHMGIGIRESE